MKKNNLLVLLFITFLASVANASELKLGIMQHDLGAGFKQRHEHGQNIIVEYVMGEQHEVLWGLPHFGATINNKGYTSAIYTGLTWHLDIFKSLYLEATFGAGLNNGERKVQKKRQAVGSNLLFRESLSLGLQLNERYNISVMVDHMSNARLAPPNPGLTDFGIRIGIAL